MIISIDIPAPDGLTDLDGILSTLIPDVVDAVRGEIVRLAHERLGTSTEDYINGLQPPVYHHPPGSRVPSGVSTVATIELAGWLPNAVEAGWDGGDMKAALLAGRNAKTAQDGTRYNTVPFRHGTPGTGGRNFPAMGSGYKVKVGLKGGGITQSGTMNAETAARLGKTVHKAAKKLSPTTGEPGGPTKWGDRLPEGVGGVGPLLPHHKTDLYAGMVRQQKTYEKATQSQYTTFRRVSEHSDPRAWVHPGIEGRHLFREAAEFANEAAAALLKIAMGGR